MTIDMGEKPLMSGRQNPVMERDDADVEADLQAVVAAFGRGWLELDGNNPVQKLWGRKDAQATTELLTLGDALRHLDPAFPGLVRGVVKKVKNDPGERKGFMFELLALRFFQAAGRDVHPTGKSAPGFDLTLELAGGPLDISLKNFTRSRHERAARKTWKTFKAAYLKARQSDPQMASGLLVTADRCPTPDEWTRLTTAIASIGSLPLDGQPHAGPVPFTVTKHALPDVGTFHDHEISYQLITLVGHHRNEDLNLLDSLEKAAENAVKHARFGRRAALMVRVRENADLNRYRQWAQDYLDGHAGSPLGMVILYQPAWVRGAENSTQLHHGIAIAMSETHQLSARDDDAITLVVPIGTTGGATNPILRSGKKEISLNGSYVMQEGRYHLRYGTEGSLTSYAPYIETVAHFGDGADEFSIVAVRPTTEDFELLD